MPYVRQKKKLVISFSGQFFQKSMRQRGFFFASYQNQGFDFFLPRCEVAFFYNEAFLNGDLSPFLSFEYMRVPSHSRKLSCTCAVHDSFTIQII